MDDDQSLAAPRAQRELNTESALAALHKRAKQLFFELLEHPESNRAALLERLCQGDSALCKEVSSLLAHHRHDSLIGASSSRGATASQDESLLPARARSRVGMQIGSILVERELGEGGMSTVYLGRDARLGRLVALKALRSLGGLDKEARSRFLREARVLSRLKHDNICEIYGYEETAEGDFLILEYIDGRSLREVRTEALPLRERDRIAAALTDALRVAHSAGVVHRDLKPENVMLTREGQVKVLDFGIARMKGWEDLASGTAPAITTPRSTGPGLEVAAVEAGPLTRNGRILGTLHYMSPEQARGEVITPASDIFSLGLLLYEIYLGRSVHPYDLPSQMLIERVRKGVLASFGGLDRSRKRLLQRMLSTDAASRPTVTEVAQSLRQIRDRRARLLFRGGVAAVVGMIALFGASYVVEISRAWSQAEAARTQLDALADILVDETFNRLSARDRHLMLERLARLPLSLITDMPDRLLREAVLRFAQRIGTAGRMRLLTGDSAGALVAFTRMLWLDEQCVSTEDNATLRRKITEYLMQVSSASDGCADPGSALTFYARARAFYAQRLADGRDADRWRDRLASIVMLIGRTSLQSGDLATARASFEHAHALYGQLQRDSASARQRVLRHLFAESARALAETGYYEANLDAALVSAEDSIRSYATLSEEMPHLPDTKASLGESYLVLGRVLRVKGDLPASLAALEKTRAILKPIHDADPNHCRWLTLLAVEQLTFARINRQRGELDVAQRALAAADTLTRGVTIESLLIAEDARVQTLLELGRVKDAQPLVEHLIAVGWQNDQTHRDFAALVAEHRLAPGNRAP